MRDFRSAVSLVVMFALSLLLDNPTQAADSWPSAQEVRPGITWSAAGIRITASKRCVSDIDFGPYILDLRRRCMKSWFPPRGQESRVAVVSFTISSDGSASNILIAKKSGNPNADEAARMAVQKSAPFRPLPGWYSGGPESIFVELLFDSKVPAGKPPTPPSDSSVSECGVPPPEITAIKSIDGASIKWTFGAIELAPAAGGSDKYSQFEFGPYMDDVQRRMKKAWFPPRGSESRKVVVGCKIAPDGTVTNILVAQSSGDNAADQAGLQAVQNAAPMCPLPLGAPPGVEAKCTFDYSVFNGGSKL